ncbi:MAG: ROK family protein [Chloroflexota bacterium]|nr:ROK family protein [Chloroflexota bacterium]MDQ5867480.1 ROK family protein [Chloroflexota bacterium]
MSNYDKSRDLLVGVDVGGTKVAVLVVEGQERVLSRVTMPTYLEGAEATVAGVVRAIRLALKAAGVDASEVGCIGVGVPGRVDPATGVVRHAVNLGWHELPLGERVSSELGVPCLLENDVRVAALGAQRYLGSAAPANMVYVSVGTGIAAGLVLDGKVYRGTHGMAGEVGHMIVEPDGPRCGCGARGCLEALAAGPAIARLGKAAARSSRDSLLRNYSTVTAAAVYEAARAGDAAAQGVTRKAGRYLALAIQQLVMAYDAECIVLGGGVSREGEAFLQPILHELERLRQDSALAHELLQPYMIRLLPPDYEAGAWGAVALAGSGRANAQQREQTAARKMSRMQKLVPSEPTTPLN